jgi:hypothetical protein
MHRLLWRVLLMMMSMLLLVRIELLRPLLMLLPNGRHLPRGRHERHRGYELEDALRDSLRTTGSILVGHHSVYLCFLLLPWVHGLSLQRWVGDPAAVPDTSNVVSRNNLCQPPRVDVPNFDEARVEEKDVRRVARNALGRTFPFNDDTRTDRIAVFVNVQTEF